MEARESQARRRWRRRLPLVVAGLAAAAWLGWAVRPAPVDVEVAVVRRGRLVVTVDEEGTTRVRERYTVLAPVAGTLGRVALKPGTPVRAGEVLAQLSPLLPAPLDLRTEDQSRAKVGAVAAQHLKALAGVRQARDVLEAADRELARQHKLLDRRLISRQQYDQTEDVVHARRAELEGARAAALAAAGEVEVARAALSPPQEARSEPVDVVAPVSGTVLHVAREDEGPVAAGSALVEVGDANDVEVVVNLLSTDAPRVETGAAVTLWGWGGPPVAAHVRRVEPSGFTRISALGVEEQRVPIIIDFDDSTTPPRGLGDRFRVQASIVVADLAEATVVPAGSVLRQGAEWSCWVAADGRATRRVVRVGERQPPEVEVVDGLRAGEEVVVYPPERVKEGARLRTR